MKQTVKKSFITTLFLLTLGTFSMPLLSLADVTPFASGNWDSVVANDLNGLSQVGTTNRTTKTSFTLSVRNSDRSSVGSKKVTIANGASDYHDVWGAPFREKYGHITTGSKDHDSWFDA